MKKVLLSLLAIAMLFTSQSCDRCGRGDNMTITGIAFKFYLKSRATGADLLSANSTVSISDKQGKNYFSGKADPEGSVTFYPLHETEDKDAFSKRTEKVFYLNIDNREKDTIKLAFEFRNDKCGGEIKYADIYFNDRAYATQPQGIWAFKETFLK